MSGAFGPLKRKISALKSKDPVVKGKYGSYRYKRPPIGSGSFGKVYKGFNKRNETIAVKEIPREKVEVEHLSDDMDKLIELDHKNITKMYDYLIKPETFYIMMELSPHGDLNMFLRLKPFDMDLTVNIFKQVTQGLVYLHESRIAHRDIKPDNMLVFTEDPTVKLADFDLSKIFPPNFTTSTMSSERGAPLFKAPECILAQKYNRPADVFSLAISFLALLQFDWEEDKLIPRVENALQPSDRLKPPGSILADRMTDDKDDMNILLDVASNPNPLKQLITNMTKVLPRERPLASEVLKYLQELPTEVLEYSRVKEETPRTRVVYPSAVQVFPDEGEERITVDSLSEH